MHRVVVSILYNNLALDFLSLLLLFCGQINVMPNNSESTQGFVIGSTDTHPILQKLVSASQGAYKPEVVVCQI